MDIQIFRSGEFGEVRTITENGKILFCGADVARALGYSNPYDALNRHCKADGVVKREGVSQTTNQHGVTTEQTVEMNFLTWAGEAKADRRQRPDPIFLRPLQAYQS